MKINKANKIYTSGYSRLLNSNNFERMIPSETFVRMYKFFINNNKRLNCLDFGVGDGRHFHYLLDKKHKVTGTDISEESLSLCKKDLKNFSFCKLLNIGKNEDYLTRMPVKNFDLIICWETIHWLGTADKVKKLIKQFKDILNKNSLIFITFPSEDHYLINKKNLIKNFSYKITLPERLNAIIFCPSIKFLKKLFQKNNLIIEAIFKYSHGRKFFNKSLKNIDLEMNSSDFSKNLFSMYAFALRKT